MKSFLDKLTSTFSRSGYSIEVKTDMYEFAELRGSTPDHVFVGPTFNPIHKNQSPSRWILASDVDGNPAAFVAIRRFDTPNLTAMVRSGHIWYDNPNFGITEFLDGAPIMHGCCYYRGGMYVFPKHRKSGLAWGLATYGQAIAFEDGADWIFANAFQEIVDKGIPTNVYGFQTIHRQRIIPASISSKNSGGECPCDSRDETFNLLTCNREFIRDNLSLTYDFLISRADENLLDLSILYQWCRETEKRSARIG